MPDEMLYYDDPKFFSFFKEEDRKKIKDMKGNVKIVINSIPVTENNFNIFRIYLYYIISELIKYLIEQKSVEKVTLNYLIEDTIKYCRNYADVIRRYNEKNYNFTFTVCIFLSFLQNLKIIEEQVELVEDKSQDITTYIIPKKLEIKFQRETSQIDKILRKYGYRKVGLTLDNYIIKLNKEDTIDSIVKNLQETTVSVVDYNFLFRQIGIFDRLVMEDNYNCFIMGEGKTRLYKNYLDWNLKEKGIKKDIAFLQIKQYNFPDSKTNSIYFDPETDQKYCYRSGVDKKGDETILYNEGFDFNSDKHNPEIVEFFNELDFKSILKEEICNNFIKFTNVFNKSIEVNEAIKKDLVNRGVLSEKIKFTPSILYNGEFNAFPAYITKPVKHHGVLINFLKFFYNLNKHNKKNLDSIVENAPHIFEGLQKFIPNDFGKKTDHIPVNFFKFLENYYRNLLDFDLKGCKKVF